MHIYIYIGGPAVLAGAPHWQPGLSSRLGDQLYALGGCVACVVCGCGCGWLFVCILNVQLHPLGRCVVSVCVYIYIHTYIHIYISFVCMYLNI